MGKIPFKKLYSLYRKVEQLSESEIAAMKGSCELIAAEMSRIFRHSSEMKKAENERTFENESIQKINSLLMNANSVSEFWNTMPDILLILRDWIRFSWGMILRLEGKVDSGGEFRIIGVVGEGMSKTKGIEDTTIPIPSEMLFYDADIIPVEPELFESIKDIVLEDSSIWAVPLARGGHGIFAILLFGCSYAGFIDAIISGI